MEEVAEQTVASESLSRSRSPSSPIPWAESMGCEEGEAKDSSSGVTSSSRLLRGVGVGVAPPLRLLLSVEELLPKDWDCEEYRSKSSWLKVLAGQSGSSGDSRVGVARGVGRRQMLLLKEALLWARLSRGSRKRLPW